MKIAGIDPGAKRTGFCLIDSTTLTIEDMEDITGGPQGFAEWLDEGKLLDADVYVVEDYIPFKATGDPRGLEIIGMLRYYARQHSVDRFVIQPPAGRKVGVPDTALEKLGWYFSGNKHRNELEAIRHVAWFLKMNNHKELISKAWPR